MELGCKNFAIGFFYMGFLSLALTVHRTVGTDNSYSFLSMISTPITNIQTFICIFSYEMAAVFYFLVVVATSSRHETSLRLLF